MITDPIANFIIALKNAAAAGKDAVRVPYSKIKHDIALVLEKQGYLASVSKKARPSGSASLEVVIARDESGAPKLRDVKRISKPSKRVYKSVKEITPVRHGFGHVVLSTPKGVLMGEAARKERVGGEVLFEIW